MKIETKSLLLAAFFSAILTLVAGCYASTTPPDTIAPDFPKLDRDQAIEVAIKSLPEGLGPVVARSQIRAELHGWYWEVVFNNINATYDELTPIPLKPKPRGQPSTPQPEPITDIYNSMIITIDSETGDRLSFGAYKTPRQGPFIVQEQAISSAREYVKKLSEAWIEDAKVEAYLRGDTWIVLFWEEGSSIKDERTWLSIHRIRVTIDALTGVVGGFIRG